MLVLERRVLFPLVGQFASVAIVSTSQAHAIPQRCRSGEEQKADQNEVTHDKPPPLWPACHSER
jgi:hypothetical protein